MEARAWSDLYFAKATCDYKAWACATFIEMISFFFFFPERLGYEVLRMFSSQTLTVLTLYGGNYLAVNCSSKQSNLKEL